MSLTDDLETGPRIATADELVERLLWPKAGAGYSRQVQEVIGALAAILGAEREDPPATRTADWVSRVLGTPESRLTKVERPMSHVQVLLHGYVLTSWLDEHAESVELFGADEAPPEWRMLDLGDGSTRSVPFDLSAYFPAGTLSEIAVVVSIEGYHDPMVVVYAPGGHRDVAEALLDELQQALLGDGNPYRGKVLQVSTAEDTRIAFTSMPRSTETRADIVLSPSIWHEVDLFLAASTQRREDLLELGLSTSRGLLLAGPPGVGKTKLARIIAAEMAGELTVLVADLDVMGRAAECLYQELEQLGPTLVILEDIDGVADKAHRKSSGFSAFINALDGARVRNDILTLATTNDPGSLDPAVKRPGRFDAIVEVPLPGQQGREEILRLYLPDKGEGIDVVAVGESLEGASGAELREVARRAVLEHGKAGVSTQRVLDITRTGRWKPAPATGHYL